MKTRILFTAILMLFTTTALQAQGLIPFQDANEKYGFKDTKGNIVVQPKYNDIGEFVEGRCPVNVGGKWLPDQDLISGGKWGYIDETGKEVIPLKYDDAKIFFEGGSGVALIGLEVQPKTLKYGLIDKNGKEIVPPKYDFGYSPNHGFAPMVLNDKMALIDIKTGKEVISPSKYDKLILEDLPEGMIIAAIDGKYGLIDENEMVIIPFQYDEMSHVVNGIFMVKKDGKWFYTNKTGIELQRQVKDGHYIYVDKNGKEY